MFDLQKISGLDYPEGCKNVLFWMNNVLRPRRRIGLSTGARSWTAGIDKHLRQFVSLSLFVRVCVCVGGGGQKVFYFPCFGVTKHHLKIYTY